MNLFDKNDGFFGYENTIEPQDAQTVIIPFGLEASVSYSGGTKAGPMAAIEASSELEVFDENAWCEPLHQYGIATAQPIDISSNIPTALNQLSALVQSALDAGKFPLTIGGEHSLTPGAIRPFVENGTPLTILQFDAHADLRDGYHGEHYSHAAAMCRCLDYPNVNLVSVGIRNISASELPVLDQNKDRIAIFWAKDMDKWSAADVVKAVGNGRIYLTFDIDGFDGSAMPATGTPEPGGLTWQRVMDIYDALNVAGANIVGADIVELAPIPNMHACDFLTAKLAYKTLTLAKGIKPSTKSLDYMPK